jgi:hypothetical protein
VNAPTDPALLTALVEEYAIGEGDLDEAVLDAEHDVAAEQFNGGAYPELEDWEQAHDAVHDDADKRGGHINAQGPLTQLAFLAEGCDDETALRLLLSGFLSSDH